MKIEYTGSHMTGVHALAPMAIRLTRDWVSNQEGSPAMCVKGPSAPHEVKTLELLKEMQRAFRSEQFHEGQTLAHKLREHLGGGGVPSLLLNFLQHAREVSQLMFLDPL